MVKIPLPSFLINFFCFAGQADKSLIKLFRQAITKADSKVFKYRLKLIDELDDLKLLESIDLPISYIRAVDDRLVFKKS